MPAPHSETGRRPLVLLYNSFFGEYPNFAGMDCELPCAFTSDKQRMKEADAVVFHLPGLETIRDVRKFPGQIWVGWSMESLANTPVRARTADMSRIDLHMNFQRSADIWCPYLPKPEEWKSALATPIAAKVEQRPAVLFQSASNNMSGRNAFAEELMRYLDVNSYGKFLNNRARPLPDRGIPTKMEIIRRYRFCLAFENTREPDYVTEKFYHPLLAGTIPVYRGAPNIDDFAPGDHCYIDANKFDTPMSLANHLRELASDEAAYASYFDWRSRPFRKTFQDLMIANSIEEFCRLASIVTDRMRDRPPSPCTRTASVGPATSIMARMKSAQSSLLARLWSR